MRIAMIVRAGSFLVATLPLLSCSGSSDETPGERATRIHEGAVVVDAHAHPKPGAAETLSLGEKTEAFELDFITMKEGGLDGVFFSVPLLRSESRGQPASVQVLEDVDLITDEVERFGDLAEIARSPADIVRIQSQGKRAVLLSLETGDPFGGDVGTLARFFHAGIRMITLPREPLTTLEADAGDEGDAPLNAFGVRVIEEMNRLGMIIDISHIPDRMQMDIIRASIKPVVASHSCTRALNDIPREVPDAIIQALAEKGGVIAVTFYPGHISSDYPDRTVTVEDLVDHIDHIVQVAGVDHVGFGSDFLGSEHHTVGLESAAGLPAITSALLNRGYSQGDIEKILGGNLLRVFEAVLESRG